tara:strand:+ start:192 stop:434 length:243 start_codon:yes stop_codon:yes gene_type:complete
MIELNANHAMRLLFVHLTLPSPFSVRVGSSVIFVYFFLSLPLGKKLTFADIIYAQKVSYYPVLLMNIYDVALAQNSHNND